METTASAPLKLTIPPPQPEAKGSFWQGETPSFSDVLDIINPLQHLPVISNLYQSSTGDKPSPGASIAGGLLFGGPLGLLAAFFNGVLEGETGQDAGGHLLSLVTGETKEGSVTHQASTREPFVSANRYAAINAYVSVQNNYA